MVKIQNYIHGQWMDAIDGGTLENYEPATGQIFGTIPDSNDMDLNAAIVAAKEAFPFWSTIGNQERSRWLMKIADKIEESLEAFAAAESVDNGKPVTLSKLVDIPRAIENFRFFAHATTQYSSESHFMENVGVNYTLRRPLGVVACISPWNLPLYLLSWKIAPALASGNTVIAKPSEITPYTAYLLGQVCIEIGLPKGVLNIVHGFGPKIGEKICKHPEIKAISFTGGTETGKKIAAIAAPMFKKLSLELGGKNANIIFADCNYDEMLSTTIRSSFSNQGQICLCGSRIFIEKSIYQKFKTDFVNKVAQLEVGDPKELSTKMGAIVSKSHLQKISTYVEIAKNEGGNVLIGGKPISLPDRCANGWFYAPTVIEGLNPTCRTNQEEIFGPVVTIMPFESQDEVLYWANNTPYGLAAMIWTKDLDKAHYIAEKMEAGIVWVNSWLLRDLRTPFGGVKNSGLGREGGLEAMRFFTEPKNICIKYY